MGGLVRKQEKVMMFIIISVVILLVQAHTSDCCTDNERGALLQIKDYFISSVSNADQDSRDYVNAQFGSWDDHGNNSNCCLWERVLCDPQQHLVELTLEEVILDVNEVIFDDNGWDDQTFAQNITLKGIQGICKLKYLQELYLDDNHIRGSLPRCIGHLTSLQILDLSFNHFSGDVLSILSNLTSVEKISLSHNDFKGEFSLNSLVNHSKLEALMLSHSGLQVKIADTVLFPSAFQLGALGLSDCSLYMQNSNFQQFLAGQHNLSWLDISHNGLSGSIPASILHSSPSIEVLILRNNSFESILDNATVESLIYLDISMNQLHGNFPANIGSIMPMLKYLNASNNALEGEIPASIGNMTGLITLDLSNNNFSGKIPSSIFTMQSPLLYLMLSNNSLHGDIVPEYMNLSRILWLCLDNNHFNGTIHTSLLKSSSLMYLDLSNNEMAPGGIPSWMGGLLELTSLAMSNNQLQGHIPSEIFSLGGLELLDLSNNNLSGRIPSSSYDLPNLQVLILRNNFLSGPLPDMLPISGNLVTLDLSGNEFSGDIPAAWIGDFSQLVILLLGHNQFHGELPIQLCQLQNINLMDLSGNNFSGAIPSCLGNMSFGKTSAALHIKVSRTFDAIVGIPACGLFECVVYESSLKREETNPEEEIVLLTKGRYDAYKYKSYILGHISGLDLSCNQLTGKIPPDLGHLEHIHVLNLSHNRLFGSIPRNFSMLASVESLDLSYNRLSGVIPSQLVDATMLGTFNVSYNNLSGEVPETSQFATFGDNSYMGNPFLCGSYLEHKCTTFPKLQGDTKQGSDDTVEGFDWEVFFWSFGASSVIIWLASIGMLWINPYWRRTWFQFLDYHVIWWLY